MVSSSIFSKRRHSKPTGAEVPPYTTSELMMMEVEVAEAEAVVRKWAVDGSDYARTTSLFHESSDEASRFLRAVTGLQSAMRFFVGSRDKHAQEIIARAQRLTRVAMERLQKEFYQLLAANRHRLDPESLHRSSISTSTSCSSFETLCSLDEEQTTEAQQLEDRSPSPSHCPSPSPSKFSSAESLTPADDHQQQQIMCDLRSISDSMTDLRAIADSMIAAGYAKECFKAYEAVRRSYVEESLFRLGFPRVSTSQLRRLGGTSETRLKSWPRAARFAVRSLFASERIICDGVFGFSDSVRESVFAEITGEGAAHLFAFPETAAKVARKSPENTFELLDVYDALVELLPEIEILFAHKSAARVTEKVLTSLDKIAEAVRSTLDEFECAVRKYTCKGPVPGGAVHPLTRYVMNYLVFLADYGPALKEIFANHPLSSQKPLPDYFFLPSSSIIPPTSSPASPSRGFGQYDSDNVRPDTEYLDDTAAAPGNVSPRVAWLLLVLLCRLDCCAGLYKENVPLAYLFLANNLNYVASKVHSSVLRQLLGPEWVAKHDEKARYYARTYLKLAWEEVAESIPPHPHAMLPVHERIHATADMVLRFNMAFEDAYLRHAGWVVADSKLRNELKKTLARTVMRPYAEFYGACTPAIVRAGLGSVLRFSPEDIGNCLSDLYYGDGVSVGWASASASPGRPAYEYSGGSGWR